MTGDTGVVVERASSLDRNERAAYCAKTNERDASTVIVRAVAHICNRDLTASDTTLYDVVDPDALDRLFGDCGDGSDRTSGRAVFELWGCRIELHADDRLVIYEPADEPATRSAKRSA